MISTRLLVKRAALRCRSVTTFSGLTSEQFMKTSTNEPILQYKKGSNERKALEEEIASMSKRTAEVPLRIGDKKIKNKLEKNQVMPSDHQSVLARYTHATAEQINEAIEAALLAREKWEHTPLKKRADILLHAADLCGGKYRMKLNASTMLGQGKNIIQAEIDAACELIDFFRFNAKYALEAAGWDPISTKISTNKMILRSMEGFVAAIAPFNFTAIGGNLSAAPALMGNVVLWKPSDTSVYSNYIIYEILEEAGIPPGVINFLPSDGPTFGNTVTKHPQLAAINFTGSVPTFKTLWRNNVVAKIFTLSIRPQILIQWLLELPDLLGNILQKIAAIHKEVKLGDVRDGSIFLSAVIDDKAFARNKSYIDYAKTGQDGAKIVLGGKCDDSKGYYIEPTLITVTNPKSKLLTEEIFGPVVTVYVYEDNQVEEILDGIKDATPYGLTGAVFSGDKNFLYHARDKLRDAVGNLYLNDKSTGSIVGQQPFGGGRMSGTNDKAGAPQYVLKWTSPQTIKETHTEIPEWRYPSMD
ncbi:unnamed protein product, partial [Mesorhabditis belari]|uniref:Aldehyde dehydrogenase domain-containing protein n=1 Tax=Mesorhabditis belari TaxID=2138241 RepID=A0AAF3EIG6_9BILA